MKNIFTQKGPVVLQIKKLIALALFFYLQMLSIMQVQAQNPVVTNSATYDVFMNLDPSRGLNPTNFATDVSTYLNTLGATSGSYRITTSAVTLDPTDVAKWEVYDHYDAAWYANQAAWSASPGGFNNGNIPSNWYYYGVSDYYSAGAYAKTTISTLLANPTIWAQMQTHGLQSHIYPYVENSKPAMQFYGYGQIAAADFLYYPADVASTKTVKFDVDASNVSIHTLHSAGFLINGGTSGTGSSKTISGYLLLFSWAGSPVNSLTGVKIYKLTNVNADNFHNNWYSVAYNTSTWPYQPGQLIATSSFNTFYTKSHIELSITSTSLTATIQQLDGSGNLTGSKSNMFNSLSFTNTGFGGFGPIVLYEGHGCYEGTGFRYSNLEMAFGGVLSGNSSLEAYQYADYLYNSTNRFFVNLTNTSQTNYSATSNDMDNAYLTNIKDDNVVFITDESTGTYLPGTLNQNIKNVASEPTDATLATALGLPNLSSLTSTQQLAAKTAYLIYNTPLGSYGTIPTPSTTAVASLYLMDGPGTDASWTGANQVNEIKSWLVSGSSINIYLKSDESVNASGLTATYSLKSPSGTTTTITTSTDANGKKYFSFPKSSATGVWSVTLNYATGGSITTTVPATTVFNFAPVPQLDGNPVISGTIQYGQTLTVTPNITSVPGITGTLSYQWKANGTSISGATNSTYTLTASEVGKTITCDVTSNAQPGTKTATASGTVSKITLSSATVSAVNSKTYNATTATTGGIIVFSGTVNSENPASSSTIVWTSANAGTSTVNVSGITLTSLTDRYALSVTSLSNVTPGNSATISKASLTVTGSSVTSKVYDGSSTATITGATLSGKIGSDDVTLSNSASGSFNDANVGTGKTVNSSMTITGSAAGNYSLSQPTLSGNITAKSVAIVGVTAVSRAYDGTTTATLSGGSVTTGVGSETLAITAGSGTFADKNVGTKAVTASGFALTNGTNGGLASNYSLSAQPLIPNQSITARPVTITGVTAASKVYDGLTTAVLSGGTISTGVGSETLAIIAGTGTFADKNVGTKVITASGYSIANGTNGGLATNYSLSAQPVVPDQSITSKNISVTADSKTKVYGNSDPSLTYTFTPALVSGDSFSGSLSRTAGENVGTFTINKNSLAVSSNYTLNYTSADLSITAKPVAVTADAKTKVYGEADPALTYTFTPALVSGDSFTGALSRTAGENVGSFAINKNNLALSSNYTLSYTSANLSITAKPVAVTADAKTKVYGEADPALTYSFTPALVSGDSFTGALSRTAGENVGSFAINKNNLALSSNYTLSYTSANLSITEKPVAVTAEAKTKVYGEADPALTYSFTPALVSGDSFTGALSRTAGENAGDYSINVNDLALSSNYTMTFNSADLTVNKASLLVTADSKEKVYGSVNPILTFVYNGFISGEDENVLDVKPLAATSVTINTDAGLHVGAITVDGGNDNNYVFSYIPADFRITKAALNATADNKTRVYGEANPELTITYSGFVNGDDRNDIDVPLSIVTDAVTNSPAGTYPVILALGSDNNYVINRTDASLTVSKAALTAIADNKSKTYSEVNPELTVSYTGFVNGDGVSSLDVAPVPSTEATVSSGTGSYPVKLSTGSDNNYEITNVDGTLTVDKAVLEVTAEDKSKIYGQPNPELTLSYSGFVNDDDVKVVDSEPSAFTSAILSSDAGSYIITADGGSDNNYSFEYQNGSLEIFKADQIITFQQVTEGLRTTQSEELEAISTSGLPVSFESSQPDIAEITGNILSVTREGTVTISAYQDGNHNYNPAAIVAQTIETQPTFDNLRSLFTPNNDGMNDYWYIPDIEQYGTIHVQIYNRYGKMVYESSAYKNDWDGTFNGKPLPEASYYYIIRASEKDTIVKGVVNIVR